MNYLMIALGGGLGALSRYGLSTINIKFAFPLGTFITNIVACFIAGFAAGYIVCKAGNTDPMRYFLQIGFCGAFSTLSALSQETLFFFGNEKYLAGVGYALGTLVLVCIANFLGQWLASRVA